MSKKWARKYIITVLVFSCLVYIAPASNFEKLSSCDKLQVFQGGQLVCELNAPLEYIAETINGTKYVEYGVLTVKEFGVCNFLSLRTAYTLRFLEKDRRIVTIKALTYADGRGSTNAIEKQGYHYINDKYIAAYYRRGLIFRFLKRGLEEAIDDSLKDPDNPYTNHTN